MNYNLLDEKWIPVLYRDGRWERVGIRKVFEDAGRIRQIAASNPMDRVAILRFLIALLYWCKGNPPDDARTNLGISFPAEWFQKLDDNKDCFNLLGEGTRFYQNDAYKGKTAEHTTNYLIHEVPSGTNKWHFRHSTDKVDGLCPACCAMGLVRLPVFATSGGKGMTAGSGKSPGINAKPPLYVIPIPAGASLASTLRLSWHRIDTKMGTPAWEQANVQLPRQGEVPLLTGMTWLPRSVWLGDPEQPESTCVSCGKKGQVIRRCVFDGKGSSKAAERVWRDPHVIYVSDSKNRDISLHASDGLSKGQKSVSASKAWATILARQWTRILSGLISGPKNPDEPKSVWIVGFSTVDNDKYLEAFEVHFCLPGSLMPGSGEKIERWKHEVSNLDGSESLPERSRNRMDIVSQVLAVRPHVEDRVSAKAGELVLGGDDAWQQAADEYRPMMTAISKSLSPGFTASAIQRRQQIALAAPDMRSETEPAKKPSQKKGGHK
jgi:hypothetical protein